MDPELCIQLHTQLDEVFATTVELESLPEAITEAARRYIPCQFVSMWLYEPADRVLTNVLARQSIDGDTTADVGSGRVRLPVRRGPGHGILENIAADIIDGVMVLPEHLIINDREADPRAWHASASGDLAIDGLRSEMCAPMLFNGFVGMLCALNHPDDDFTEEHLELLHRVATQAAIAVWSLRERQRADSANRLASLGRAFDYVRHEMQTPLTVMKGAVSVLRRVLQKPSRTVDDDRVALEMVDMIDAEIGRNTHLLDQIRMYAQPSLALPIGHFNLNEFLRKSEAPIIQLMRDAKPGAKGAAGQAPRLCLELAPDLPLVPFSEFHLLVVLRNLVRNACDARCREVVLSTALAPDEQGVLLVIADDGGGVDEAVLETLFGAYDTTRLQVGGAGLGLFLCRRVIEEGHGGRVHATNVLENGVRRGLRVELTFPL